MLFPMFSVVHFYISTLRSVCAVADMEGFCRSLIYFRGVLLRYCLSDFEMVPFAPIITAVTFVSHSTCAVLIL